MLKPGLHANWRAIDPADWPGIYWKPAEMGCKCGTGGRPRFCEGEYWHDPVFVLALDALRLIMGRALRNNSGRRCKGYNAHIKGATRSQHLLRIAVDIDVAGWTDADRRKLLVAARMLGFTGIGYAATFLHLDRRPGALVEWQYAKGGMAAWKALL